MSERHPNMPNVGFPPDSAPPAQQGHQMNPAEVHAAQMRAALSAGQPQPGTLGQQPNPVVTPQNIPAPPPEPIAAGNLLQQQMGTDAYFEWVDFAMSQNFLGIKVDLMDRMDLLAMCGKLIGDLYQADAQRVQPQQPQG